MTYKQFGKKLRELIDNSGDLITDTIEMKEIIKSGKKQGFGDTIVVCGQDHTEVFVLSILKV